MPDETSLQETGAIPLREALRRVIRRRGDVGRRAAERWCRVSFRELTRDEDDILHIGARMLFEWLQQGKLKALHRSDKQNLAKKIPRSVWVRCKLDEIHWHLSAIRAQPQACMIENIEVSALDVERLISQPAVETEKLHPSKFSNSKTRTIPAGQRAVLQYIVELAEKGTYITDTTRTAEAIILIQKHAIEKRNQGNMAVKVPDLTPSAERWA